MGQPGVSVRCQETVRPNVADPRCEAEFDRWIAYIGAIVTILSLAFGAFTQQLIAINQFPVPIRDASLQPGNIPRAETCQYNSGPGSDRESFLYCPPRQRTVSKLPSLNTSLSRQSGHLEWHTQQRDCSNFSQLPD